MASGTAMSERLARGSSLIQHGSSSFFTGGGPQLGGVTCVQLGWEA